MNGGGTLYARIVTCVLACACGMLGADDCNLNGIPDVHDIERGVSEDCNGNGVPDDCDLVPVVFGAGGETLLPGGGDPKVLSTGDLDGDGFLDLVLGTWENLLGTEGHLHLFFHNGTDDLVLESSRATVGVSAVEAADFDGDGALDILTVSDHGIAFYPNDGAGGIGAPLELITTRRLRELVVRDVDLDGRLDVVTLHGRQGTLIWYNNPGADVLSEGRLGEGHTFDIFEGVGPRAELFLVSNDLDGDGDVDLAIATTEAPAVTVLENREYGDRFVATASLGAGGNVRALAVGDFDGDGLGDVVSATTSGRVVPWRSLTTGEFAEGPPFTFDGLRTLALAQVDADGVLDLVIGTEEGAATRVVLLRGVGDGTFRAPLTLETEVTCFGVDDFDADGDADIAVSSRLRMTVLFQGERRTLPLERKIFETPGRPHSLDVGDFNGDSILDVVTANSDPTHSIFLGRGDGSLELQDVPLLGPEVIEAVLAVDLDRDGSDDLVVRVRNELLWVLNQGAGKFGEPTSQLAPGGGQYLGRADVDGDGNVDVLVPNWLGARVLLYFGDGRGGLSEGQPVEVGRLPWMVASGDLDGDGDEDLVVPNRNSSDLSFVLQREPRSFAPTVSVPIDRFPRAVALCDVDQDGDIDVMSANETPDHVAVFLNRGDGVFDVPTERVDLRRNPAGMIAADIDGDGLTDLVTTDGEFRLTTADDGISLLLGKGAGVFSRPLHFATDAEPRGTMAADMDSDGDLDLVVGHRQGRSLVVLLQEKVAENSTRDFFETVCTELDFELISVPERLATGSVSGERAVVGDRRTSFLLGVRPDRDLPATMFINETHFAGQEEFLRQVFPGRFGDLSGQEFVDLVMRRGTRAFHGGSLRRVRLQGERARPEVVYGFDVRATPGEPEELLSFEETRAVFRGLQESFPLAPLVYFPTTIGARGVARGWDGTDLPTVVLDEVVPPEEEPFASPTFFLEIPEGMVLCGVFAQAGDDRGPAEERELKSQVRLRAGRHELPTAGDAFVAELLEEVLFGANLASAESLAEGVFRVVRLPDVASSGVTIYRFTYAKPFVLEDGRRLDLEIVAPLVFHARGEEPLVGTKRLPQEFTVALKGREPLQGVLDGVLRLRYGSCAYESLPLWKVEAELKDGALLRMEERFEEAGSLFDTAPASVVRAEVFLDQDERVVTDYEDLVYSAARHNTRVDYWLVLDPPVGVAGLGNVHVVELRSPEDTEPAREASAAYLGADLEVLRTVAVSGFSRELLAPDFLRGDADGDGTLTSRDAVVVLEYVFRRGDTPSCAKAGDANDDGTLNVVDAISTLSLLFGRDDIRTLPEPFPECGVDSTPDILSCPGIAGCR